MGNVNRILQDVCVKGNVDARGDVCLEGKVFGKVSCEGELSVKAGGIVEGDVKCGVLVLEGEIAGNVDAGRAVLKEGGVIRGALMADKIEMTVGVKIALGLRFKKMSK